MDKKDKLMSFIVVIILIIIVIFLGIFFIFNANNNKETPVEKTFEIKQYENFASQFNMRVKENKLNEKSNIEEVKTDLVNDIIVLQKKEKNNKYINQTSQEMLDTVNNYEISSNESITDSINKILEKLKGILDGNLGLIKKPNPTVKLEKNFYLKLRSNTVCSTSTIDSKYCLNELNAQVFIANKNSNKWAILVHGFTENSQQIYDALGEMYTSQGINVLAPDLRGAGKTDGEVAMGYLESLDVYDWIKDLNENYNKKDRYDVLVKPESIIVHGVSLGGATTVQLGTNPDIANANGTAPYTKNLTQLNVKGFVDDCGYYSMTGIIKSMLLLGDSSKSTTLFGLLGIDKTDFLSKLKESAEKLNIPNLPDIQLNGKIDSKKYMQYIKEFSDRLNEIKEATKPEINSENNYDNLFPGLPDFNNPNLNINDFLPSYNKDKIHGIFKRTGNFNTSKKEDIINKIIKTSLIKGVPIGLTEENYDKYSNSFSSGRHFPKDSKIIIVHGTKDFLVNPSHGKEIAKQIIIDGSADLLYKWDVENESHAFIIFGKQKDKYKNLISNFTNCVNNNNCEKFNNSNISPIE